MQLSFKAENYAEFQHTLSILASQLNSQPHIISVTVESVEEALRIDSEAKAEIDDCISQLTGEDNQ